MSSSPLLQQRADPSFRRLCTLTGRLRQGPRRRFHHRLSCCDHRGHRGGVRQAHQRQEGRRDGRFDGCRLRRPLETNNFSPISHIHCSLFPLLFSVYLSLVVLLPSFSSRDVPFVFREAQVVDLREECFYHLAKKRARQKWIEEEEGEQRGMERRESMRR